MFDQFFTFFPFFWQDPHIRVIPIISFLCKDISRSLFLYWQISRQDLLHFFVLVAKTIWVATAIPLNFVNLIKKNSYFPHDKIIKTFKGKSQRLPKMSLWKAYLKEPMVIQSPRWHKLKSIRNHFLNHTDNAGLKSWFIIIAQVNGGSMQLWPAK